MVRARRGHRVVCHAVAAGALLLAGCAGCSSQGHPADRASNTATAHHRVLRIVDGHYAIPAHQASPAGTLIAARQVPGADTTLGSGRRFQILYDGPDPTGQATVISGQVLLPHGNAPDKGWPIIAWAHGTTGLADRCAPSLAPRLGGDNSAVHEVRALLARGFAVVATDYPGLGTPGVHPYLIGSVNGAAVVDSVLAARQLLPGTLGRKWAIVGHSEGGQTALFAAQVAVRRAPEMDYLGVVALAPASLLEALPGLTEADHDPVDQAYLAYALAGLGTVDHSVHVDQLLGPAAQAVIPDFTGGCIDQITDHFRRLHLATILDASPAGISHLGALLGHFDDPDHHATAAPVLLLQGLADTDVPAGATVALRKKLVALGDHVSMHEYPGIDHTQLIPASIDRVTAWLHGRFGVTPSPRNH